MRIFFTTAYQNQEQYEDYYEAISKALLTFEHEVVSTELGNQEKLLTKQALQNRTSPKKIHQSTLKSGVNWADILILEVSQADLELGYRIKQAQELKKPVLCLSIYTNTPLDLEGKFIHQTKYTKDSIRNILSKFINKYNKKLYSQRFNCFLSPAQMQYLNFISQKNGVNKSAYIRKLLEQDRYSETI